MEPFHDFGNAALYLGSALDVVPALPAASFDAVVTDPPYGLGFMGKAWDHEVPGPDHWRAALAATKPGGYLLAFGGTRTFHRLACAIEDSGWEPRDCLCWLYGTGFPKGKGCLKPAWEPILMARNPGPKTLPLGADECRVASGPRPLRAKTADKGNETHTVYAGARGSAWAVGETEAGRYPANVVHDGSAEVLEAFAEFGDRGGGGVKPGNKKYSSNAFAQDAYTRAMVGRGHPGFDDGGNAARFFYCAKASRSERGKGNNHPAVKPLALMDWLIKLVCPKGGKLLDPYCGSGTTLLAAVRSGRRAVGVDDDPAAVEIAVRRVRRGRVAAFGRSA